MKKLCVIILIGFITLTLKGQNYILQNNKFITFYGGFSSSNSFGEYGTERNYFLKDFVEINNERDLTAKINPRNSYNLGSTFGVQFNTHIYFGLNVEYSKLGHKERFITRKDGELKSNYKIDLNMDYLKSGIQIILFHPKNFKLHFGYSSNYSLNDEIIIKQYEGNELTSKENLLFHEYYKSGKKYFLGALEYGIGYNYKSFGIDLNLSYSSNAFLLQTHNIHFLSSRLNFTYYLIKNKNNENFNSKENPEG